MKGIEVSKRYFEQYGLPMLREKFPELLPLIAAADRQRFGVLRL